MSLTLMYITNNTEIAKIAEQAGVDRIWVDLEYKGKELRQAGLDTVKSKHTVSDVKAIRSVIKNSALMVRVNPLDENSKQEIDDVINAGADYVMLPMYKTRNDVEKFISYVGGRAKTMLLLETVEAEKNLLSYVDLPGINEIHIGLNDLHLAYKKTFMFELLVNGTVERIAKILKKHNVKFGFGGIARVGYGMLPAEKIITEHYRLGSQMAILSRAFCNANSVDNPELVRDDFILGVANIRKKELEVSNYTNEQFIEDLTNTKNIVESIVSKIKESK